MIAVSPEGIQVEAVLTEGPTIINTACGEIEVQEGVWIIYAPGLWPFIVAGEVFVTNFRRVE
jgi:hypothetical protein